jgi:hypothetical protein
MPEGPKDRLSRIHTKRSASRSKISLWLSSVDKKSAAVWDEYIAAYRTMAGISVSDLLEALSTDETLGKTFPEISSDSLKKWMSRNSGYKKDPEG